MYYISDESGIKGEICNASTISFISEVAKSNKLKFLKSFLDFGVTTNTLRVVNDLWKMDWPGVFDIDTVVMDMIETLESCNGVAFLESG